MPTTSRRKSTHLSKASTSLTNNIQESPEQYSFFQAVRLLERALKTSEQKQNSNERDMSYGNPVARFVPPSSEAIRFATSQALRFTESELDKIKQKKITASGVPRFQWQMTVNFMGLTGSHGVLPYHYTELILKRLKIKDESFADFLDLFNHRTISLFYQAGSKYNLPLEYERKKLNPPSFSSRDCQTQVLLSLIGLGTNNLTGQQYTSDESLIFYSGLLSQQLRTASGLKQILRSHFDIPVKIEEFVGQWQELIDDVRSKLPCQRLPLGQNNQLGKTTILGKKGWFAQGKIRIILGPLSKKQAQKFAPDTKALYAMNEIVQFYLGMEYEYEFIVRITRSDSLDKAQLNPKQPPIMGWNTWVVSKAKQEYKKNETLDISVSSKQFN